MNNKHKDDVYIVSLSNSAIKNTNLVWSDIVLKKKKYFYPLNGAWPQELSYIGFRYNSELQSIYRVDNVHRTNNLHELIDEMPDVEEEYEYLVYDLEDEISINRTIKYGEKITRAIRVYCNLKILLNSDTITEAYEKTKEIR